MENSKKIKVTQVASSSGCVKKTQLANLKGLGLGRIGKQSVLEDNVLFVRKIVLSLM